MKKKWKRHVEEANGNAFKYKIYSADIARGKLSLIGIPAEYHNQDIAQIMSEYVEVIYIKEGLYKDFPTIKNGLRRVTYKKANKEIPQTLTLDEGIQIRIQQDNKPNYNNKKDKTKQNQNHQKDEITQESQTQDIPTEKNPAGKIPTDGNMSPLGHITNLYSPPLQYKDTGMISKTYISHRKTHQ